MFALANGPSLVSSVWHSDRQHTMYLYKWGLLLVYIFVGGHFLSSKVSRVSLDEIIWITMLWWFHSLDEYESRHLKLYRREQHQVHKWLSLPGNYHRNVTFASENLHSDLMKGAHTLRTDKHEFKSQLLFFPVVWSQRSHPTLLSLFNLWNGND